MIDALNGALFMGYVMAGVFFLRFWREAHDRLFAWFAVAFLLLALQRALLTFVHLEWGPMFYTVRLVAFVVIIVAIVDKNRRG